MRLLHGNAVECRPHFAVEGVWDGPFASGDFHRAEHFFGSGIRLDRDGLWLVPSRALVDRLFHAVDGQAVVASNSLALMLAYTGARLDPAHDYRTQSFTILKGIDHYEPAFPVVHPRIGEFRQLYFHPVLVTPTGIERAPTDPPPRLSAFAEYRGLVEEALARIRENLTSRDRTMKMGAFSTISAGYDSPAVTLLGRDMIGASFTSRRSNSTKMPWLSRDAAIDDGTPIARRLGVKTEYLDSRRSEVSEDELYFLAPSAAEPELIFHSMCRHIEGACEAAVVLTGFHGDKVWDAGTGGDYLSDQIKRGDVSGLALSEVRLKAGFINVAVPFMYSRSIRDLVAISRSPEMEPWRLGNSYDRPIPRRMLEEAGIPRAAFGRQKKAVVRQYDYPVHPELRKAFLDRIRERHGWRPGFVFLRAAVNKAAFLGAGAVERVAALFGARGRKTPANLFWGHVDLAYEMHLWAIETLAARFAPQVRPAAPAAERDRVSAIHQPQLAGTEGARA